MTPHTEEYRVIRLTRGCVAVVDADVYDELSRYKWSATWEPTVRSFYAACAMKQPDGTFKTVIMARYVMDAPKGLVVDHINHNTLDNRRENLRLASDAQNAGNSRLSSANTSGFKGVSFREGKWRARIVVKRQRVSLGVYSTKEEAAKAYDDAAQRLFGEFARTNASLGLLEETHISQD